MSRRDSTWGQVWKCVTADGPVRGNVTECGGSGGVERLGVWAMANMGRAKGSGMAWQGVNPVEQKNR